MGIQDENILQITEFFHPRIEEVCDPMPTWLGKYILQTSWLRKFIGLFCNKGHKIKTTSLTGFVMLYFVAGLKRWRRKSLSFSTRRDRD